MHSTHGATIRPQGICTSLAVTPALTYSLNGQPILGIGLGGQGTGVGGLSGSSIIHNHSLAAGFDKAISTTLLTDFRFGLVQITIRIPSKTGRETSRARASIGTETD